MFKKAYNVGDKVKIRSLKEFEENYPIDHGDFNAPGYYFVSNMFKACESIATITGNCGDHYEVKFDDPELKDLEEYAWTIWMMRGID